MSATMRYKFRLFSNKGIDLSARLGISQHIVLELTKQTVRDRTDVRDNSNKHWVKTWSTLLGERKFQFEWTVCGDSVKETALAWRKLQEVFAIPWNPRCGEFFRIQWQDWCWDITYWSNVKVFKPLQCERIDNSCRLKFSFCLISVEPWYYWECNEKKAQITDTCGVSFEPKPVLYEESSSINFKSLKDSSIECKPLYNTDGCCVVCNKWNFDAKARIIVKGAQRWLDVYNETNWSRILLKDEQTTDLVIDDTWIVTESTQMIITDKGINARYLRRKWTWLYLSPWTNCITFESIEYSPDLEICLFRYDTYV